jgi:CRISPR-associated protein Cas1
MANTRNEAVAVLGYGPTIRVRHGQLEIIDTAPGGERRERTFARHRPPSRILNLSSTGALTGDAIRWLTDTGCPLSVINPYTGEVRAHVGGQAAHDDPRLVRAAALAPTTGADLVIARGLIARKLAGQRDNLRRYFGTADHLAAFDLADERLAEARTCDEVREAEAIGAVTYWAAWVGLRVRFVTADRDRVPAHWRTYDGRHSPVGTSGPKNAVDPVNAVLNYLFGVLEAEAVRACQALGVHPGLGVLHGDRANRPSMALDLMEAARPLVEARVLALFQTREFRRAELGELPDGQVRLMPTLLEELVGLVGAVRGTVGEAAEFVAHALADAANGKVDRRTPLTRANSRDRPGRATRPGPSCRECGTRTHTRRQVRCPACRVRDQVRVAREKLADPTTTPVCRAKYAAVVWDGEHAMSAPDPAHYREVVFPALQAARSRLTGAMVARALDLSPSAGANILGGRMNPHPRHWATLVALASA